MPPADIRALVVPMAEDVVRLQPLAEDHRAGLKTACAADTAIWAIYPASFAPDRFDGSFDALLADPSRHPFVVVADGVVVGMSGYLNLDPASGVVEIGGTYLAPAMRGTGLNARVKALLIGRAIACGFQRIEFRIDMRNARSMAAIERIGAVREGVLRRQRVTWTGHVRDTAVYAILAEDWTGACTAG